MGRRRRQRVMGHTTQDSWMTPGRQVGRPRGRAWEWDCQALEA